MAEPKRFTNYDGRKTRVLQRLVTGRDDCPYCRQWGVADAADTDRYLRSQELHHVPQN